MNAGFTITNNEITLRLVKENPADSSRNWLRSLHYEIVLQETNESVGEINVRIGYTASIVLYGGHIGYTIWEKFRGSHFAGKACLLLKDEIKKQGLNVIWITCNPENIASRKTCEFIGAKFIETVTLPEDNDQYLEGERQKCRYRWRIY